MFRYMPVFPVGLGIALLLLGWFLAPEVTRVLWMIAAGLAVGMGLVALLVMRRMAAWSGFAGGCCSRPGQNTRRRWINE